MSRHVRTVPHGRHRLTLRGGLARRFGAVAVALVLAMNW